MSTLGIAICMGLYYWIARLRFGYTISSALLQPTTIAVFVGIITGQMALAMEIGAALQLVYLGVTSTPGGNVPNDSALAGTIAIPLGVMSGMTPELAVALAVPLWRHWRFCRPAPSYHQCLLGAHGRQVR